MKDINKIKLAITHAGTFHTDDVISTVFIKLMNPEISIVRKDEVEFEDCYQDTICYDIGLGEFDHHQEDNELDDFGNPYSAFGKLWRAYGKEFLGNRGFKNINLAFNEFNKAYVTKINLGDNKGYKNVRYFNENELIKKFNPTWYEVKRNPNILDEQFFKAVEFATMIFENWIRDIFTKVELNDIEEDIWQKAITNEEDGIIVLDERINWHQLIKSDDCEHIKFIIMKNLRGQYSVVSKDSEEIKVKSNRFLSFVHNSGFMGVADTLEDALRGARLSLC